MNRWIYYLFHLFLSSAPASSWWPNHPPGKEGCLSRRILKKKCIYFNDFEAIPVWLREGLAGGFLGGNDCIYETFLMNAFYNLCCALLTLCQCLWTTMQNHCFTYHLRAGSHHYILYLPCWSQAGQRGTKTDSHFVAHSTFTVGLARYLKTATTCRFRVFIPWGRVWTTSACRNCSCSCPMSEPNKPELQARHEQH